MKKKILFSVCIVAAAAALVIAPSLFAGSSTQAAVPRGRPPVNTAESVFSVRIGAAEKASLRAYIEVNGDIVTDKQVSVVPDAAGKLVSLNIAVGSVVTKGQLLGEVDPSKPGVSYSLSPIYAPLSGTVTAVPLAVGSTVTAASEIAVVSVMKNLEITAMIPEREVGQLKAGLTAEVRLAAFPGETFAAAVTRVSPVVDQNSRAKKIVLSFNREDSRINAGMFAQIKLNTRTYADRITVPSDSIVELRGNTYVYVFDGIDTVTLREIAVGVTVDDVSEITEGLSEGEVIITQGQQFLSNNA
ncbi:MAG: efflux RND transporter periplasmic adaptor subunit, partial [Spirochaetaceae bacterium]|nr:efflux RND transporter periplasmic adaptor subunit [Spirochaetaceae bacterium]